MTWITPFDAATSVLTMLQPFIVAAPLVTLMSRSWPSTVFTICSGWRSAAITLPGTTWYVRIVVSCALSARIALSWSAGILANAAFVGREHRVRAGPVKVVDEAGLRHGGDEGAEVGVGRGDVDDRAGLAFVAASLRGLVGLRRRLESSSLLLQALTTTARAAVVARTRKVRDACIGCSPFR